MPKLEQMNKRQLKSLVSRVEHILESRKDSVEYDTVYVEKGRGQNKELTKDIDFLVAKLSGSESAQLTRLSRKYFETKKTLDEAKAEAKAVADQLKELSDDMFDQIDKVNTRLIASVSYGFLLSKRITSEVEVVDYEGVVNDLAAALDISKTLLEKTIKANTTVKNKTTPERLLEPSKKYYPWLKKNNMAKNQVDESAKNLTESHNIVIRMIAAVKAVMSKYLPMVDRRLKRVEEVLGNA